MPHSLRRNAAAPIAALLAPGLLALAFGMVAACAGPDIPTTMQGSTCATDDDCDPGDNCVQGQCIGNSSGSDAGDGSDAGAPQDAGEDAGTPQDAGAQDAGSPADAGQDAGADAGQDAGQPNDAGQSDAGPTDAGQPHDGGVGAGQLTLSPATASITARTNQVPASPSITLGNSGSAGLHWALACTGGAQPSSASGALTAGSSVPVPILLPTWTTVSTQSLTCTATSSDGAGGPLTWTLSANVLYAVPTNVNTDGGTVDLLDFSFTGDTRPAACDDAAGGQGPYPQATFESELTSMMALSPQFAFDLGDHMYVCDKSLTNAQAEMKQYTDALAAKWSATQPFFMTMGNHECQPTDCSGTHSTDPNYTAYAAALKMVSKKSLPYYAIQVQTRLGRASFVFIADHYFDSTAQSWLTSTLDDADAHSAYTFIVKHYPVMGSRAGPTTITNLIQAHHYSLVLTAHDHDYQHDTTTAPWNGRTVICGLGGANTNGSNEGFCRVQQNDDGSLRFTRYQLGGNPGDSWSVSARQ